MSSVGDDAYASIERTFTPVSVTSPNNPRMTAAVPAHVALAIVTPSLKFYSRTPFVPASVPAMITIAPTRLTLISVKSIEIR